MVPGLGSRDVYQQVAEVYCAAAPGMDACQLAASITCAKAWTVVEVLAHYAEGSIVPTFPLEPLLENVPGWLIEVGTLSS